MAAPEWARIANTTIHEFIRDEEVNILRNRKLLAMMRDRGRITFGHSGDVMDWKVRYKRAPMTGYADSDTLTFARRNKWLTAQLEWRGYQATDSIHKLEKLKNKGQEAIIKIATQIVESLMDDMDDQFGDELYVDGRTAANAKRIHGIESFMSTSGAATNGFVYTPTGTYAGLLTDLAGYGGSWSSTAGVNDWPTGTGDAHYDFWSPLIIKYTGTGWAASTKTWPNTCLEATSYAIIKSKKNKSKKGMLDMIVENDELYRQFISALRGEERLTVSRGDKKGGLIALGFEDVVNFDGVDVTAEYGLPTGTGYGFNMQYMELRSLQDQLFLADPIDFDIASQSDRFAVNFFGNLRFNPRYHLKLAA